MSLPDTLEAALGEEGTVAEVRLGGEDLLAVTPSRTLVYRADGLLSDESVDEYSHDVERIDVSEGRRKAKLSLDYGIGGEETLKLPGSRIDDALHPMLAGALSASGITDPGESVLRTFRFSELTLVVTDNRLVKHIGSATWDDEFETFDFDSVTDLGFEEGTVATSIVLTLNGRQERFKAPNDEARAVRETLFPAVCNHHGVESVEELRLAVGTDDTDEPARDPADFGAGPDPLDTSGIDGEDDVKQATAADNDAISDGMDGDGAIDDGAIDDDETTGAGRGEMEPRSTTNAAAELDEIGGGREAAGTESDGASGGSGEQRARRDAHADDNVSERNGSTAETDAASTVTTEGASGAESGSPTGATDAEGNAFEGSGFEPAGVDEGDLAAEVAELREVVQEQSERIDRQAALVEQLVEELRRGR